MSYLLGSKFSRQTEQTSHEHHVLMPLETLQASEWTLRLTLFPGPTRTFTLKHFYHISYMVSWKYELSHFWHGLSWFLLHQSSSWLSVLQNGALHPAAINTHNQNKYKENSVWAVELPHYVVKMSRKREPVISTWDEWWNNGFKWI